MAKLIRKGGKGSGNWGHAGRPGKVGGSAPRDGVYQQGELFDVDKVLEASRKETSNPISPFAEDWSATESNVRKMNRWILGTYDNPYLVDDDKNLDASIERIAKMTGLDPDFVTYVLMSHDAAGAMDDEFIAEAMEKAFGDQFGTVNTYGAYDGEYSTDDAAAVLRAMYDVTQNDMKLAGIDNVRLYKMINTDFGDDLPVEYTADGMVKIPDDAIQSWSTSKSDALNGELTDGKTAIEGNFVLMEAVVPANRVLSINKTGFGNARGHEVVIIGSGDGQDVANVAGTNVQTYNPVPDAFSELTPNASLAAKPGDEHDTYDDAGMVLSYQMSELEDMSGLSSEGYQSDAMAALAKNDVASYLSQTTNMTYDEADDFIRSWAKNSNDGASEYIQKVAADMFHDKLGTELSSWQKSTKVGESGRQNVIDENRVDAEETTREALRAMYNRTQEQLADVDGLTLYRGILVKDRLPLGGEIEMDENALESWTASPATAHQFASGFGEDGDVGYVLKAYIPRERILSTPLSGFGALSEQEFVVIGSNVTDENGNPVPDKAVVGKDAYG